jgi:hypothetical protein
MKFKSVEQAVRFSMNISERQEYARTDMMGIRGTNHADLSPTDLHAQAAMIVSMIGRLHPVERDAVFAMYGRGKERTDAIRALADYLMPHCRDVLPSVREVQIILFHWSTKRPSIRAIAEERGVSYRMVCSWRTTVLRAWMPVMARAIDRLHQRMFGEGGFDLDEQ